MALAVGRVAAAIAVALALSASDAACESASSACRGPARLVDLGSDGRIGAKWNAATRTIAYGRPQPDGDCHGFIADIDGGNARRIPPTFCRSSCRAPTGGTGRSRAATSGGSRP